MSHAINDIRSRLIGGGARNSQFDVIITNPVSSVADINVPFMCKAASLPGSTVGKIEVPYFGRKYPIPGDRVVADWTVTIINDETFDIRNALEVWQNAINDQQENIATLGSNPGLYMSQATVTQYGRSKNILRTTQLNGIWPLEIAPIDLAWETTDTIEEFQVTFAVSDILYNISNV